MKIGTSIILNAPLTCCSGLVKVSSIISEIPDAFGSAIEANRLRRKLSAIPV